MMRKSGLKFQKIISVNNIHMALKYFNIRSKEVRIADTEPMIAAMYNSSDKGPNALVGQDFGWRLAPEVVVEMKRIVNNPERIQEIANRYRKPFDEVSETDVLRYISDQTAVENAPVAIEGDYEDEYRAEIRKLEGKDESVKEDALSDAISEALELGIDVEKFNGSLGLIKSAITRRKKANANL